MAQAQQMHPVDVASLGEDQFLAGLRNQGHWKLPTGALAQQFANLADHLNQLPPSPERADLLRRLFWIHRGAIRLVSG